MTMRELLVVRCGRVPYEDARRAQQQIASARGRGAIADTLLLLEHPPVYTKGRRSEAAELPMGEDWYRMQGIDVVGTDRGGRVTYHGPGQLVGYPIVSLPELPSPPHRGARRGRADIPGYVALIEGAIIAALGDWGIEAQVIEGLTGVWTAGGPPPDGEARKIGSIGIHVSRGITTHGLAVNVNNDLQPFEWVVPCGIEAVRMTSLSRELGSEQDLERFAEAITDHLAAACGLEAREVAASALADEIDGVEALGRAAAAALR